ncbi:hypothetical protein [Symbiobacterium thermophilum]|uniref:Uncharacterized protein n=1 Tax=Symbiobacterium thermophilum TaxID=2734 RepID=A0A953I1N6_SYMTR|nr:hypothetical protein [Symbiobacterium thermophilum]MBY6275940.1 hypothetical protein [Symbiobacterium thermophilum]
MEPHERFQAYERLLFRRNAAAWTTIIAAFVVLPLAARGWDPRVAGLVALGIFGAYIWFIWRHWRCPQCGHPLGRPARIMRCAWCGAPLTPDTPGGGASGR